VGEQCGPWQGGGGENRGRPGEVPSMDPIGSPGRTRTPYGDGRWPSRGDE
jgi:hypothetical protein